MILSVFTRNFAYREMLAEIRFRGGKVGEQIVAKEEYCDISSEIKDKTDKNIHLCSVL